MSADEDQLCDVLPLKSEGRGLEVNKLDYGWKVTSIEKLVFTGFPLSIGFVVRQFLDASFAFFRNS